VAAESDPQVAAHWAKIRKTSGLSRERFAEAADVKPAAVWRIETHGRFKAGELERLLIAFPSEDTSKVGESPGQLAVPETVTGAPAATNDLLEEDLELIQWVDVTTTTEPPVRTSVIQFHDDPVVVFPGISSVSLSPSLVNVSDIPAEPLVQVPLSPWQLTQRDGITRLSNSELRLFRRCRRSWWLSYYRRLTPISEPNTGARAVGDRIHRALRWHYHGDTALRVDVRDAIENVIAFDWQAICDRYPESEMVPSDVADAFKKESDLERIMVEGYVEWLAETGEDSDLQVVGSEQFLEAELPGMPNVRLVGKIDARVRRVSDGLRLFMDHKTLGAFGAAVRMLPLDEQMLFYMTLERYQDENVRCVGALYNMMRRVKRTATATPPFYKRVEVHHSVVELDAFEVRLRGVVHDLLALRERLDAGVSPNLVAYPLPDSDCTYRCNFNRHCSMFDDGSRVESALAAYFVEGDPTGYYLKGV